MYLDRSVDVRSSRIAVLALLVAATTLVTPASAAEPVAQITVNVRAGLGTVSDAAIGVNHAVWDSQLGTNAVADLMKGAGVQAMRYPGGSYSDIYHWRITPRPVATLRRTRTSITSWPAYAGPARSRS